MRTDPLLPSAALLPLCGTRSGGTIPPLHQFGPLRPFSATLAIRPLERGKHDTTATKWDKEEETQSSGDGQDSPPKPDTVKIPQYDT